MNIARTTVTAIYDSARKKIADALVRGKRLLITGGCCEYEPVIIDQKILEKRSNTMRIAVTYENGMVGQHFGRTEQFKLYDIENGAMKASQVIDTNGTGHGALAGFLRAADVQTLICGGIGMGARMALQEAGVVLLPGVDGRADDVVAAYLNGTLQYNPDEACHHHDHEHGEGHDCHHGQGCGEHGCH